MKYQVMTKIEDVFGSRWECDEFDSYHNALILYLFISQFYPCELIKHDKVIHKNYE